VGSFCRKSTDEKNKVRKTSIKLKIIKTTQSAKQEKQPTFCYFMILLRKEKMKKKITRNVFVFHPVLG
jgi:hypothetical protein